jgi:hypothetical protein
MLLKASSNGDGRIFRNSCYMVSDKGLKSLPIQRGDLL